MSYKKLNTNKGFTIIEVLIVLAIAGLILLIVFLAVPALQRSARNTTRKNDVSALSGGITEYQNNNNGSLPQKLNAGATAGKYDLCLATPCVATEAKATVTIGYYKGVGAAAGDIEQLGTAGPNTANAATDNAYVLVGDVCNGTGYAAGSSNSVAIEYGVETSGGFAWNCVE